MAAQKGTVCVTGAGGYLGSWVVQLLLSNGYLVHGTVRDPSDEKYAHLKKLENASENLKLFKADLLDYNSLYSAIEGCIGVFHVACPVPSTAVPNPEMVLEPAINGTQNVLRACDEAKVKRVIVVSSVAAVYMIPNWPTSEVMTESCWSDKEYCRTSKNWYCVAKTEAESQAFEYAKQRGLDVVTVCPSLILGPILQSTVNASTLVLLKLLKGGESVENKLRYIVDVRDVAEALLLAYEKPEAEGRYICSVHTIKTKDIVEKLRGLYPNYNYPQSFTEVEEQPLLGSEKLQKLGWSYRSLEETLVDSVESYKKAGILD
ncbi:NAD(P)-binding Rossmann-fold superfamily protein [Euphorbia peplus]|nr:NAD(P)-binding Rossmann-fold superfamily protein [Euphorbia peplus]